MGIYRGDDLREISFPIGGIGTGSIGLAGNGRLIDWEIFNRPNKGSINGYSHIAVKAKTKEKSYVKILNGDQEKDLIGQYTGSMFTGYGYGPASATMCGFPHFKECTFKGEFPIAEINFKDDDFPSEVKLTAFNPFIPLDDFNSSIPAAFYEVGFNNPTSEEIVYTAIFSVKNPFSVSKNITERSSGVSMIRMIYNDIDLSDVNYGDVTAAIDAGGCSDVQLQAYWYRGGWQDGISTYWREISESDELKDRFYETNGNGDMCSLSGTVCVAPNEKKTVRFVFSWNIPNNYFYLNSLKDENGKDVTWKNYYATIFENSLKSAEYSVKNWDSLYSRTLKFKDTLFNSTLDPSITDAISSTMSVLKSPTVLRLEDGSFYGWEGCHEKAGSCEGTCSHVWNYAYALCFLFPKLERSIRELEFKYNTYENGEMDFRLKLPLGRPKGKFRACVDGQCGSVIKTYREWKISGDTDWLKNNWETIRKIIEYPWNPTNEDKWDYNKDGVLEGRQHHTLDMELYGPSSWLEGFYLAALKAGAEMAMAVGLPEKSAEYMDLFNKGYTWTKENLFNGEYFIHKINLNDKSLTDAFDAGGYWNDEAKEIKYQIGEGSAIDQICAQWHSNIVGLGDIFDKNQCETALKSMYKNNFKRTMRNFPNAWRIFSLNDEAGAVICDYPEGTYKPVIPIPYCDETMYGFEYQLAGLLIGGGMYNEGLEIVKGVRDKYDGKKRNPWNEIECGNNYARSMASFALLPIISGFKFDMVNGSIGFDPIFEGDCRYLWSIDGGWGEFIREGGKICINVFEGKLNLKKLSLPFMKKINSIVIDGKEADFTTEDTVIIFNGVAEITQNINIK